jgi:nicotinamidase-related amidase
MTNQFAITTRHWRLYNPTEYSGPVEVERTFALDQTAFVPLHIWNVGLPGGPEYPIDRFAPFMCTPEDTLIAHEVIEDTIVPCLEAARSAGMVVFHVEIDLIANRYPISSYEWQPTDVPDHFVKWTEDPEKLAQSRREVEAATGEESLDFGEAIPGWWLERANLVHGPGHRDWEGGEILDRPDSCKPAEGEYVIKTSDQFDRILRRLGIVNLVYVGFTTQGCIQVHEGGIGPMNDRGYRCMIIREGTHGVEFPDTRAERMMTKYAIRVIENRYGFSIGAENFIKACESAIELK